jgi:protein TonB
MVYPMVAIESNIEGRVTIKVLVGPDGHVIQTGALTGPEVFYDEVRDKAKNLEFTSGLQNGKAVKVWMTVPFNFKLKDK